MNVVVGKLPTTTRTVKNTARKPVLHHRHMKAIATCQGNNSKLTIRRPLTKKYETTQNQITERRT
jgi:hypothetical protein